MPSWKCHLNANPLPWLLDQDAPWTRYRTLLDLLDKSEDDPVVLLHSIHKVTVNALPNIIKQLKVEGYAFDSIK